MDQMRGRLERLYGFRHLLKQLVLKDIKLKYRRSFLGYLWSVLNPLLVMLVMLLVFSHMFRSDIENFPAYLIIGQTLFNFMSEATNQAIFSITGNAALLKKVYVPKYIFTLSKVTSSLVNLLFAMGAMAIVLIASRVRFSPAMLFIPVILTQLYVFSLGLGLFLAQGGSVFSGYTVYLRGMDYRVDLPYTAFLSDEPAAGDDTAGHSPVQSDVPLYYAVSSGGPVSVSAGRCVFSVWVFAGAWVPLVRHLDVFKVAGQIYSIYLGDDNGGEHSNQCIRRIRAV